MRTSKSTRRRLRSENLQ
ncbi:hypothetical protein [Caulobacter sp. FWC2]